MSTSRTFAGPLTAAQMNDISQGSVGYAAVTATQGSITTFVDLTSLTVTVTMVAGRRLRIKAFAHVQSTVANDIIGLRILEDGSQIVQGNISSPVANWGVGANAEIVRTPAAGSHTWKLQCGRDTGTGTISMAATATIPAFILVEDIGT